MWLCRHTFGSFLGNHQEMTSGDWVVSKQIWDIGKRRRLSISISACDKLLLWDRSQVTSDKWQVVTCETDHAISWVLILSSAINAHHPEIRVQNNLLSKVWIEVEPTERTCCSCGWSCIGRAWRDEKDIQEDVHMLVLSEHQNCCLFEDHQKIITTTTYEFLPCRRESSGDCTFCAHSPPRAAFWVSWVSWSWSCWKEINNLLTIKMVFLGAAALIQYDIYSVTYNIISASTSPWSSCTYSIYDIHMGQFLQGGKNGRLTSFFF